MYLFGSIIIMSSTWGRCGDGCFTFIIVIALYSDDCFDEFHEEHYIDSLFPFLRSFHAAFVRTHLLSWLV